MWIDILKIHPRIYRDLPPNPDTLELLHEFVEIGQDVKILTALPSMIDFDYAEQDKRHWCAEYLPNGVEVTVCKKAIDKQTYAAYNGVPNVLIDDSERNIKQWSSQGGIGFLYNMNKE